MNIKKYLYAPITTIVVMLLFLLAYNGYKKSFYSNTLKTPYDLINNNPKAPSDLVSNIMVTKSNQSNCDLIKSTSDLVSKNTNINLSPLKVKLNTNNKDDKDTEWVILKFDLDKRIIGAWISNTIILNEKTGGIEINVDNRETNIDGNYIFFLIKSNEWKHPSYSKFSR